MLNLPTSAGRALLSGAFNPKQISGLKLWLDAADPSTLRQDSALTTAAVADGDPVGGWLDKSGSGSNAIQSTSGKRPVLKLGVQGGRNGVRLDGVDDCLQAASIALPTFITVCVVGKFTTGNVMMIEQGADANSIDGFYFRGTSGDVWQFHRSSGLHSANGISTWMGSSVAEADLTYSGAGTYALNGTTKTNGVASGTARSNSTATAALNIGSRNQASLFSSGDFYELLIWDSVLSTPPLARVRNYLKKKWGTP